ncbi:hypothetical protein FTUN_0706 [Frigoriglobus tundricola]|uniref:Uncharacterized protein n=1 Tax=Frigoriglobus tundricola TaxID=2774151 RepID=A0A6M5YIP9_9BACT|nr:hypothetical protein FTUN_0706 [Frigoriglobus tundricola]
MKTRLLMRVCARSARERSRSSAAARSPNNVRAAGRCSSESHLMVPVAPGRTCRQRQTASGLPLSQSWIFQSLLERDTHEAGADRPVARVATSCARATRPTHIIAAPTCMPAACSATFSITIAPRLSNRTWGAAPVAALDGWGGGARGSVPGAGGCARSLIVVITLRVMSAQVGGVSLISEPRGAGDITRSVVTTIKDPLRPLALRLEIHLDVQSKPPRSGTRHFGREPATPAVCPCAVP